MSASCSEVKRLRKRFEDHMNEHRLDEQDYNDRQLKQDLAQAAMVESIAHLTKAVQPLVDGITVLVVIHKLVKWLSGFAFLGVIVSWFTGYNPFK